MRTIDEHEQHKDNGLVRLGGYSDRKAVQRQYLVIEINSNDTDSRCQAMLLVLARTHIQKLRLVNLKSTVEAHRFFSYASYVNARRVSHISPMVVCSLACSTKRCVDYIVFIVIQSRSMKLISSMCPSRVWNERVREYFQEDTYHFQSPNSSDPNLQLTLHTLHIRQLNPFPPAPSCRFSPEE